MKKFMKFAVVFLLCAVLCCSLSFVALAENDNPDNPDKSVSDDATYDGEAIITIGASDDSSDDSAPVFTTGTESETSEDGEPVVTIGAAEDGAKEAAEEEADTAASYTEPIQFVLLKKFQKLDAKEWIMFGAVLAVLIVGLVFISLKSKYDKDIMIIDTKEKGKVTKILVVGAISLSLSFVLSYVKLFSMPYGGSITLCSMLPVMIYAAWVGPKYGFLAAFAYGLLQLIQGTYVGIHWASILLDYVLAFSALGLTSLFKSEKLLPVGILIAGFARMFFSILSGYLLFAEYAPEGMNPLLYAVLYNALTIGVDTIICMIVYIIPPVRNAFNKAKATTLG